MTAPAAPAPESFEPFAVDHILVNDLPSTLGTLEAPERYTVTAVFTRRPLQQELDLLAASDVDDRLTEAGYQAVTLRTADRRLLIDNTNLAELRDGLAHLIGSLLDDIGSRVATTRSTQAKDAAELASRAAERAHQVLEEVSKVDFSPKKRTSHYH
ncbi:hypothetical protein [Agromyces sp. ZXT2-6]|uniref:hypothetical protein n=1 Tax=Agromyces sp. ZXT2-6 TaxID=3461153 RepID=UPI004054FF7A